MLHRAVLFVGLVLPVAAALTAGCSSSPPAPIPEPAETLIQPFGPDASDTSNPSSTTGAEPAASGASTPDAAAPPPAALVVLTGNTLCHTPLGSGCSPDAVINACELPQDGGSSGADASGAFSPGCHVAADGSAPVCLPGGGGMKNSYCAGPSDCAAGHECVGAGFCHRYCCSGDSDCAVNEFCDIQPMVQNPATVVPVCMTTIPCALLDNDACPSNEQCGVVREDGTTSCVAVGTALKDESCENAHCARELLCLGAQGARSCAKLCYKGIPGQCPAKQNCVGALPLFLTPTVGVCQ
jgi:hypothetical protein